MNRQRQLLRTLVERALRGADALSLSARADLHEAISIALRRIDPLPADLALHTAGLMRQAENRQLELAASLRP